MKKVLIIIILTVSVSACSTTHSPYDGIEHRGKDLSGGVVENIVCDSIFVDAENTSMNGQWLMRGDSLIFMDHNMVAMNVYASDGSFSKQYLEKGNGPGELLSPAWRSVMNDNGQIAMLDHNQNLIILDNLNMPVVDTKSPWFVMADRTFGNEGWNNLGNNPDLSVVQMYEYNFECRRLGFQGKRVYIPLECTHVKLNPYETRSKAKKYWREGRILGYMDYDGIEFGVKVIGSYPPVYHKSNIPVFLAFDFVVEGDDIIISFAADPNIYILDNEGKPLYSFGVAAKISGEYPSTSTYDEYEEKYDDFHKKYGHYQRLFKDGDRLLRTCMQDDGTYLMQVYENENLVKNLSLPQSIEIFGKSGEYYYAYLRSDLENEKFVLVKFKI